MKFMNLKRFGATVMAGVMSLSLAVPAFATSTVIDGAYNPVTLAVTVPKTAKAIINPYGLPYDLDETTAISGESITTGAPLLIENRSKVALEVGGTVTGAVKDGSDLALVASLATPGSDTPKEVVATVELFEALGVSEATLEDTEGTINPKFAALDSADAKLHATVDPDDEDGVDLGPVNTGDKLILREGSSEGELQNGGAGFFRLSGDATLKPAEDWTKNDGFTVTVAFTFTPATYAALTGGTADWKGGTAPSKTSPTGTVTIADTSDGVKAATITKMVSDDANLQVVDAAKGSVKVVGAVAIGKKLTIDYIGSDGLPYQTTLTLSAAISWT